MTSAGLRTLYYSIQILNPFAQDSVVPLGSLTKSMSFAYSVCNWRSPFFFFYSIDVDLPLEVDDEYYDKEKKEWKQPEGKVSMSNPDVLSSTTLTIRSPRF
jgi:hypothetical protein